MLLIVFGTRGKKVTVDEGDFYCPNCNAQRHYEHIKIKRYFALYFIPLIPVGEGGEYIECTTCRKAFDMQVLQLKAAPPRPANLASIMNQIPQLLRDGTPIEYLIRDLTTAGLDLDVALTTVQSHVAGNTKKCNQCGLTYLGSVTHCHECGNVLG